MTVLQERRRAARRRRVLGYWGVLLGMYASLVTGAALTPPAVVHFPALFVHLAAVIVGLGAAVVLELAGLLWATGRLLLVDVRRLEHGISVVAWLGIVALLTSGALLAPDLSAPLTIVKMTAVLIVAMNGVAMGRLTDELARLPDRVRFSALPRRLQLWCVWSALVSQVGWWTAVLIGMVNTSAH